VGVLDVKDVFIVTYLLFSMLHKLLYVMRTT